MVSSTGVAMNSFTSRKKQTSFTISDSTTYSDPDDAAAVTYCARENQLMALSPINTVTPETERRVSGRSPCRPMLTD